MSGGFVGEGKGKGKGGKLEQLNSGLDICCILNSIFDDILPSTLLVPFITDILWRRDIGAGRAVVLCDLKLRRFGFE